MTADGSTTLTPAQSPVTYRTHRPGDLGLIVHRQAVVYLQEYNFADPGFEAIVAQIAANFLQSHDPAKERCWIAEQNGEFIGSIMLIKHPTIPDAAQLRVFFVEPKARGLGVGRGLMRKCVDFAREVGYKKIQLRTEARLAVARGIYKKEGFEIVEEVKGYDFEEVGEVWEKVL